MTTHVPDSGLGEALASYQPTSLTPADWARFREDALELVARLGLDASAVKPTLSRLAVFLADLADVRPDATLEDLLTPEQVKGYLERAKRSGEPAGTLQNRQGSLNALLRAQAGEDQPSTSGRSAEPRLMPYDQARLLQVYVMAVWDGSDAAADFARTVLCALVGSNPPSGDSSAWVEVDRHTAACGGSMRTFPAKMPLPTSGMVDQDAIGRGRRWARRRCGFRLDLRRLVLSYVAHVVATRPAVEALQLDGVGRDRLTAAVAAAPARDEDAYQRLLRG